MNKIFSRDKDWVLLIGYVALIYATLPIMPRITAFFSSLLGRNFAVAANSFLIAIIIIIFAFIFKHSPIRKNPISYIAVAALFAVYLAFFFIQNIFKKTSIFSVVIISICGTLIYEIFVILILLIGGIDFQFGFIQIISQVIYNLIVLVPLFYLTKKFIRQ